MDSTELGVTPMATDDPLSRGHKMSRCLDMMAVMLVAADGDEEFFPGSRLFTFFFVYGDREEDEDVED